MKPKRLEKLGKMEGRIDQLEKAWKADYEETKRRINDAENGKGSGLPEAELKRLKTHLRNLTGKSYITESEYKRRVNEVKTEAAELAETERQATQKQRYEILEKWDHVYKLPMPLVTALYENRMRQGAIETRPAIMNQAEWNL